MVDECHTAKADSLKGILEKCHNARRRVGCTGTLDGSQTHELVIQGLLGVKHVVTTTRQLMTEDVVSDLKINVVHLHHAEEDRRLIHKYRYKEEIDFIISHETRNDFVARMVTNLSENSLVLFRLLRHGDDLYQRISELHDGKVFLINGEVSGEERDKICNYVECNENCILVASYGTLSTGVSIRNLHNIVFASPLKKRIPTIQSIGRILRKNDGKSEGVLYDIVDDLTYIGRENYAMKHGVERMNHYHDEKFTFSRYPFDLSKVKTL